MRLHFRAVAVAAVMLIALAGAASAQGTNQIALTEKQVQSYIAAQPAVTPITEKLQGEPDKKTQAQLDAIVKKNGFANFQEYDDVAANIFMVLQGIDPKTKKFGDPKAMLQSQIAEVQAEKTIKPAEKKQIVDDLNEQIKNLEPIKNKGNIALVEKYFDKLSAQ